MAAAQFPPRLAIQCGRLTVIGLVALLALLVGGCSKRVITRDPGSPDVTAPESRTVMHKVSAGESLALIADNYYGDPQRHLEIARQNGLSDPGQLAEGSVLVLEFDEHEWQAAQKRAAAMQPYNQGVDLLGQERLEEAEAQFRAALNLAPDFVNARYNLALVLGKRAQYAQAETILADLLQGRPEDRDFLFAHGHVLFLQGRFGAAVTVFRRLLDLQPDHRRGAFSLARSLQESGRRGEAAQAWEAYLALDSTSSWADAARRSLQQIRGD